MLPLCDTNVISELCRVEPNPGVLSWAVGVGDIALSVVTIEEIFYGLSWKPRPRVQASFERFFADRCTVYPVSEEIARRAGALRGRLAAKGATRTQADMLIAATALDHDLTLVTRNVRDFEGCGIALRNPFS